MRPENLLMPLTDKCKSNGCTHKKCGCGHCSHYHLGRQWECAKVNQDLTTCNCKELEEEGK